MKRILSIILVLLSAILNQTTGQTLEVDTNFTAQFLVENMLSSSSVQVSNAQYFGNNQALGSFNGANSNIGLSSGIILSTGLAIDAEGPVDSTEQVDLGTSLSNTGDITLESINGGIGTFDAASLEFDFVTDSSMVSLRYVFASDDYMFYVGSGVSDAIALFISGPGISGEQNIALVPNSNDPVNIDNINANVNSGLYVDNENPAGLTVGYNGFTVPLTASISVTPGVMYHARIVIADSGDDLVDSALLIDANSLSGSSNVTGNGPCAASFSLFPNPFEMHSWFALDGSVGVSPMTYTWDWGDGMNSVGQYVSHTYDSAGYYNICLTITDAIGCSGTYCDNSTYIYKTMQMVTVNVVNELPNGIAENEPDAPVVFYPNPTSGKLQIDIGTSSNNVTINAYSLLGELVGSEMRNVNGLIAYDMPKEKGVYIIRLVYPDGKVFNLKAVKE